MSRVISIIFGFILSTVLPDLVVAEENECRLDALKMPTEWLNRGLKQKTIKNLMTDYYPESQIESFRDDQEGVSYATYAMNQGKSRSLLYPAPGIEKQLNLLAEKLLTNWPHAKPEYRILVSSSNTYGPLTSQDSDIIIPAGFLYNAESEDEIAFILGHELSHILLLHAKDAMKKTDTNIFLRNFYRDVGQALLVSNAVNSIDMDQAAKERQQKKLESLQQRSLSYYEHARELMTEYVHPSWQKTQEDEADLLALELALKAGYSFEGVLNAFENMKTIEKNACVELKRFAAEMQVFVKDELSTAMNGYAAAQEYDFKEQLVSELKSLSEKKVQSILQQQALPVSHRPYDKRLSYVQEYAERPAMTEYFDTALDTQKQAGILKAIKVSQEYKQLITFAELSIETQNLLETGNLDDAKVNIEKLPMVSQYGRILKYRLRRQQGNSTDAIANLELALRSAAPALDIFEMGMAHELEKNQLNKTAGLIARAEKHFNDKIHFLPETVFITQVTTNNRDGATSKILEKCLQSGRDYMEGPCYAAATAKSPFFRDEYDLILASVDCKSSAETGGDVICTGDKPYEGKGTKLFKLPGFLKSAADNLN